MALKIVKASEPIHVNNLITFIYGDPGIGKTSRAFSAKNPILFDFDQGAHRAAQFRKDCIPVGDWLEVANITKDDLDGYDTVIIDTAGRMLDCITAFLITQDAKNRRADGALSLQGFGKLGILFSTWLKTLRGFGKDIILLAHAGEDKKGENVIVRPDMTGKSKTEAYKVADLMAYMTTEDGRNGKPIKVLEFSPSSSYLAKDSGGLGRVECPDLTTVPDHMAQLIQQAKDHINNLTADQLKYQQDLDQFRADCIDCTTADELNAMVSKLDKAHPRYQDMRRAIGDVAQHLPVAINKATGKFEDKVAA